MKNKKLELLRTKLAMFALATSLSVSSLSGCSLSNISSSEKSTYIAQDEENFDIKIEKRSKDFGDETKINVCYITIENDFTKQDLEEVNDFLTNNQEIIDQIVVCANSYNNKEVMEETLKVISSNNSIIKLILNNLNFSDISGIPHLKKLVSQGTIIEIEEDARFSIGFDPRVNAGAIIIESGFAEQDIKEINDFLTYVQENIYKIYISAISYNDKEVLDEILRIISTNSNVTKLSLTNLNNINLSDILQLSQLKILFLQGTTLEDVTQLNQFTQLEELTLNDVLDNLNNISNLTQLKSLQILGYGNLKLNDIEALKKFINLEELILSEHNFSDITPLSELIQLQYLVLNNNNIKDISPLISLENLETVRLCGNPIENLSVLKDMKSIANIYLSNNDGNLNELKPYIEEMEQKGFQVYDGFQIITKDYLEQENNFMLERKK